MARASCQRLDQFQISQRGGVEDQRVVLLVKAERIEMKQGASLRIADVMKDGSGGPGSQRMALHAVASQRDYSEMVLQQPLSVFSSKDPLLQSGLGDRWVRLRREMNRSGWRQQQFPGTHPDQLFYQPFLAALPGDLRDTKVARREISKRQADGAI